MTRLIKLLAIASIALTLGLLVERTGARETTADRSPEVWLGALDNVLDGVGLRRRTDVGVQINGRNVAHGYSRPGCDGLLLVSPLPRTAQGWRHVAPRLDLGGFEVGYLYRGVVFEKVPRLRPLADRLLAEFTGNRLPLGPRVTALAERGRCELLRTAIGVLPHSGAVGT